MFEVSKHFDASFTFLIAAAVSARNSALLILPSCRSIFARISFGPFLYWSILPFNTVGPGSRTPKTLKLSSARSTICWSRRREGGGPGDDHGDDGDQDDDDDHGVGDVRVVDLVERRRCARRLTNVVCPSSSSSAGGGESGQESPGASQDPQHFLRRSQDLFQSLPPCRALWRTQSVTNSQVMNRSRCRRG